MRLVIGIVVMIVVAVVASKKGLRVCVSDSVFPLSSPGTRGRWKGALSMLMRQNRTVAACKCLIISTIMISPVFAEDSGIVKEGFYLGTSFVYNCMSGGFNDSGFYMLSDRLADVPDVASGMGFGVMGGIRGNSGAMELGYQRTTHSTRSSFTDLGVGGKSTATYNVADWNFKIDLLRQYKVRPFIELGFGIPWLTLKNSAVTASGKVENVTYWGFCLDLGGGVVYYFHPQWALTAGILYRWNRFSSAAGDNIEALSEGALGFTLGIAYTF